MPSRWWRRKRRIEADLIDARKNATYEKKSHHQAFTVAEAVDFSGGHGQPARHQEKVAAVPGRG
jgi:hypothetical protein